MDSVKIEAFKDKIVGGVLALTSRTLILQAISFILTFIVTILLSPSVFGVFFIVSAVISFLTYFSDIGLAAALVQKKEEPERSELVSVFTLQQLIVLFIVSVVFLFIPQIAVFYKLSSSGIFLLKALLVAFFLSSLKTIPSILLERKLEFSRLVLPQILENLAFYLTAIVLAYMKMGEASFAWAALSRGIIGLISIYFVSPWLPGIGFSFSSIKKLITFGVPFQANSLLALVKDDLLTLYLGYVLPATFIGYLGWAKKWAEIPLRLIMDSIIKVTFPAFSRIQHEKAILEKALNKTVLFLSVFTFPVSILLIIYIKPLLYLLPKYLKWLPALPSLYLFALSALLSAFSSPMINALNALGKINKTLTLMTIWTVMTWILVPLTTYFFGFNGWAVSSLIISSTVFLPVIMLKKFVTFRFFANIIKPFAAALIMSFFSFFTLNLVSNLFNLVIFILISIIIYFSLILFFLKKELSVYLPIIRKR